MNGKRKYQKAGGNIYICLKAKIGTFPAFLIKTGKSFNSPLTFLKIKDSGQMKIILLGAGRMRLKMREITKKIMLYKYSELNEKAKAKVKQDYLNSLDPEIFTDEVVEDLQNMGLKNLRPYYSLSYCQGDGVCLHGHIDFDEIKGELKKIFYKDFILSDYKFLKSLRDYSRIEFTHVGRYYHKYSVDINVYIDGDLSTLKYKQCRKTADKLLKNIKDWYVDICDKYEQRGYEVFYEIEDDELEEYVDIMEYEFLENGKIFREERNI